MFVYGCGGSFGEEQLVFRDWRMGWGRVRARSGLGWGQVGVGVGFGYSRSSSSLFVLKSY